MTPVTGRKEADVEHEDFQTRPTVRDDRAAIVSALTASELAFGQYSTLGADFVSDAWDRPGFDLGTDSWATVCQRHGLVAYGQVQRVAPDVVESWGVVHPSHLRLGIGTALFQRVERRAQELVTGEAAPTFRHAIDANDAAAKTILDGRGLRPVRHFWHMQADLTGQLPNPAQPRDIRIAGVNSADGQRTVHSVIDEALEGHWGHHSEPFDQWLEDLVTAPGYEPGLWSIALADGRPAGALTASMGSPGIGWIDWLGVLEPYRGRGVASALLQHSFAGFGKLGVKHVRVSVDSANASGATRVYERSGMKALKGWEIWERTGIHAMPGS